MLRGRRATVAAVLAIVSAAAVTAGCGGGSTGSALSLDPVAAAATKSQHAGAARIRFALALSSPQIPGKTLRMRATGAIDGTSGELTFNLGSLIHQMGAPQGTLPGATMAHLSHAKMKEIFLEQGGDYVVYMRLGALASQMPGGKQWLKLDVSKLGKSAGLDFGKLLSGSQLQPTDLLGMLRGEGATIRKVGSATIDGTATTHYRVTVDVAKALEAKGLTSPLVGTLAAQIPKLPENVWIGKDGLVRRVAISYNYAPAGRQLRMHMTMNISDYGTHVRIAAPPSSQVFDATQLAQSGFGSALLH
jgi:BarA-like signal transduction histidine kinase